MDLLKAIELAGSETTKYLSKNQAAIFSAIGVGSFLVSTIWAVQATPKAINKKNAAEQEKGEPLTGLETIKACGKEYIPSALMFGTGVVCIIESNKKYSKQITALATAASLSETALREYKEQVVDSLGVKKEKEIRDKVAQKQLNNNPPGEKEVVMIGAGEILCYEPISGKYFRTTVNEIGKVINQVNSELISDNYLSVNDYLSMLGLRCEPDFDDLGWQCYSKNDLLEVSYGHKLADDNTPALVIVVNRQPVYDYNKVY